MLGVCWNTCGGCDEEAELVWPCRVFDGFEIVMRRRIKRRIDETCFDGWIRY